MLTVRHTAAVHDYHWSTLVASSYCYYYILHTLTTGQPRGLRHSKSRGSGHERQTIMRWRPGRPHNPVSIWPCSWATSRFHR
ncbi:hypothetical protein CCMA1212_004738 [Trichoderma ghanense]|uniref:Uncharacterized protein n=1 Tax=Trichoderma ghanense TaxID=65468 RepID=A0ABY2H5N7_9HYPO